MADPITEKNTHDDVPHAKKVAELHALIAKTDVAMLTTRDAQGRLIARPMATQAQTGVADVWFMTSSQTHKVEEIDGDADVNVAYLNGNKEWISISGTARIDRDRARIRELYKPDWRAWFEDEGGDRDGGPEDPRIVLIDITAHHVTYFKIDAPRPIVLFEIARAVVTHTMPNVGAIRHLEA